MTDSIAFGTDLSPVASAALSIGEVGRSLSSDQKFTILTRTGHSGLQDLDDLPPEAAYMITEVEELPTSEAMEILREASIYHDDDVNFPLGAMEKIRELLDNHSSVPS
ncbi:hypothetical protein BABINDRAFT_5595 [Babjeviella inositovora NRRL Y-12698]|uniref:Uncharacterized protein n=1 Tax=Babjeviella inositovora NRRL Y-12698 TaxID=984486 RepID=A0A1E3QYB6_9ASCO|nr:uncharacterized protein BABINDRAFT_5595 [Babjeviella inositovora NRRL Y-12698]ODQ82660.1 hypothetical protein BABINDRAFT_5595 [Babjeviella inositovora NRRL Y-12698]